MEVTIPKSEQVFGKNTLQIFKIFGTKAAPTDLAALQYCWVFPRAETIESKRSGAYYIQFDNPKNLMDAPIVSATGEKDYLYLSNPQGGIRPIIPPSETEQITPISVRELKINGKGSLQMATFGEYPQKIADTKTQNELNTLYFAGLKLKNYSYSTKNHVTRFSASFKEGSYVAHGSPLKKTQRKFTMNDCVPYSYNASFLPNTYQEFRLKDRKFIQFFPHHTDDPIILSGGETISRPDTFYWIEVKPIEWIVDPSGVWISKDILLSNIKFDDKSFKYRTGLFKKSFLDQFLRETFSREITAPVRISRQNKKAVSNRNRQNEG